MGICAVCTILVLLSFLDVQARGTSLEVQQANEYQQVQHVTSRRLKGFWPVSEWLSRGQKGTLSSGTSNANATSEHHKIDLSKIGLDHHDTSQISRIIHQSWKTSAVDQGVKEWQQSWKDMHPEWTYILWTDEMNRKFVEQSYSWFLPTYDNFPSDAAGIMRADSVRYLYLHHFGGVYADLDFRALKPMDDLLRPNTSTAYLGTISSDVKWDNNLPNAWMASSHPGHPFWLLCAVEVMRGADGLQCKGAACFTGYMVEKTTGPMLVYRVVQQWLRRGKHSNYRLKLLEPGTIYPIDWRRMYDEDHVCYRWFEKPEKSCYSNYPNAYTITYWSHTWDSDHLDRDYG